MSASAVRREAGPEHKPLLATPAHRAHRKAPWRAQQCAGARTADATRMREMPRVRRGQVRWVFMGRASHTPASPRPQPPGARENAATTIRVARREASRLHRACTQRLNGRQPHEAGRLSERTTPSCECFQVISVKTGRAEAAPKHGERVGMEESAPLPSRAAGLALPELSSPCPLCSPPTRCELSPMAVAVPPVLVNTPPITNTPFAHCPS